jgi:hypothetical protein
MTPACGRDGLPVPPAPSLAQSEAGDPSHEVKLGRLGEAQADRIQHDAFEADVDVVLVEQLRDRIVSADVEVDEVNPHAFCVDVLSAGT